MTTTTLRRRAVLATATLGLAGLLAACGSSSSTSSTATTAASSATTKAAAAAPTATGVWARTSAAMQSAGAAYMVLENGTDVEDALVKASVDASVAKTVEIHETVASDSAMGSATTMAGAATTAMGGSATTAMGGSMGGAMKMQPVDKIVVPAKGKVELKPGGYHIMLLDLAKPLVKGESFDITLTFASGATSTVKAEVKDQA